MRRHTNRGSWLQQIQRRVRGRVLFWGIALATLVAGFIDLARGGETIGPLLLVLAYCVLIPIAILK
jgi:hypothetical protein